MQYIYMCISNVKWLKSYLTGRKTDVVTQSQLVRVVDYTRQIRRICLHNDIMKRKFEQN
jgi:hypothetical protein